MTHSGVGVRFFRAMKKNADGLPKCGVGFANLGVRPVDIPGEAAVKPETGGMSISQNANSLKSLISPSHGGEGRFPLFEVDANVKWDDLKIVSSPSASDTTHACVEPNLLMTRLNYLHALCNTGQSWRVSNEYVD